MFKFKQATLIACSACVWLFIGSLLLFKGLRLFVATLESHPTPFPHYPLVEGLQNICASPEQAVMWLILLALFLGYFKGRVVLAKSVRRVVDRIKAMPNPANILHIYSRGYYILIAGMIGLGVGMNLLHVWTDIRALVDVTIGSALIQGAILYFREARALKERG